MNEKNQGEGNRAAARNYDKNAKKFVDDGKVEAAAKEAEAYVDANPEEAAKAEEVAKMGPDPVGNRLDELKTEGKALLEKAKAKVRDLLGK